MSKKFEYRMEDPWKEVVGPCPLSQNLQFCGPMHLIPLRYLFLAPPPHLYHLHVCIVKGTRLGAVHGAVFLCNGERPITGRGFINILTRTIVRCIGAVLTRCGSRGGGGLGARPPPPTPQFEAQIFADAAIPLRDVGKISPGPPPLHKSWIRSCLTDE